MIKTRDQANSSLGKEYHGVGIHLGKFQDYVIVQRVTERWVKFHNLHVTPGRTWIIPLGVCVDKKINRTI